MRELEAEVEGGDDADSTPVHPTLPAVGPDRAGDFGEGTLGLKVEKTDPSPWVLYQC